MGYGLWIWNLSRCEEGDPEAIVRRAQTVGLSHVVVKIADGANQFNGPSLRPFFERLRAAAVKPYAWAYAYGDHPEAEAEVFAERAVALDAAALIVDAEGDRFTNSPARAWRFMQRLRTVTGSGRHVGLSTHRFPTNHPSLPIAAFMEECDSGWPQCYYLGLPPRLEEQMERVRREWAVFGKPLVVTGAAYPEGLGDADNIVRLVRWCESRGISQQNAWSWEHATEGMWEKIAEVTHGI